VQERQPSPRKMKLSQLLDSEAEVPGSALTLADF